MKRSIFYFIFLLLTGVAITSCSQYDDTEILKEINSLDERVKALETKVDKYNVEIANIKALVNNQQEGYTIVSYTQSVNGYYRINFSNGSYIDIASGKNGADGINGVDGKDGKDGVDGKDGADGKDAPVIGVKRDIDGVYYWTITTNGVTMWLTGDKGEKLPVSSVTYVDGGSGNSGTPGTDGKDGKDGKDGVTPVLSIDLEGYWIVSYNNGATYDFVRDVNGNKVSALGKAVTIPGNDGGFSYISSIKEVDDHIVITLYDGSTMEFLKYTGLSIDFGEIPDAPLYMDEDEKVIPFVISGYDDYTYVETLDKGNAFSKVKYMGGDRSHGSILVSAKGSLGTDSKVVVFLYNRQQTIVHTYYVYGADDDRIENVVPEDIIEKMEPYIPIYRGINPPNIEGAFTIDPMEAVFCEDYPDRGGFAPGTVVASEDIKFYNQDMKNNTVAYSSHSVSTDKYENAVGAFISGEGNFFSIFFNTEGESAGAHIKTALVISGEKTATGIKDIRYAFVMVDDGGDPNDRLMENGVFRVFMDGDELAKNKEWQWGSNNLVKVWNPMKIKVREQNDDVLTPFSIIRK